MVYELADRTRAGEALAGAVLLGATTSLSGSVLSVTAAWKGHADLALSNALGGIAVQTAFLAVADIAYRRANLEHAAASAANLMQGALLITLMAIILVGAFSPAVTVFGIHPATPALLAISVASLITAPMGAKLAHNLEQILLKRMFGIYLIAVSVTMFVTSS